jgi:SAM-dependent methyltransferase
VVAVDMNRPLPFEDGSFDAVLLFNALYVAEDPDALAREVHRVLRKGGVWYLASPLVSHETREPHDYVRFTSEGLARLCTRAGFSTVAIEGLGERATAATQLMHPFFLFGAIRAVVFPLALLLDRLVPKSVRSEHPTPIAYFVSCTK